MRNDETKLDPIAAAVPEQFAGIVADLKALKATPGWALIVRTLEAYKSKLNEQILDKVDEEGEPLEESQADELRKQRSQLKMLIGLPDSMISSLETADPEEEDGGLGKFDPFFKVKKPQ